MSKYLEENEIPTLILQIKKLLDEIDEIQGNYRIKERNDKAIIFETKEELRVNDTKKNILTVWLSGSPRIRAIGSHNYDKRTPFDISDLNHPSFRQDILCIYSEITKS